jgi:DEP domain-containing protein 5
MKCVKIRTVSSALIFVLEPLYKNTHLDIDVNSKSDRIEWGHARYQASWRPYTAYEMCIQWITASGNIVADLVSESVRNNSSFYSTLTF